MVSETNGWEADGADTAQGETHMDAQTKRLEGERARGAGLAGSRLLL